MIKVDPLLGSAQELSKRLIAAPLSHRELERLDKALDRILAQIIADLSIRPV